MVKLTVKQFLIKGDGLRIHSCRSSGVQNIGKFFLNESISPPAFK